MGGIPSTSTSGVRDFSNPRRHIELAGEREKDATIRKQHFPKRNGRVARWFGDTMVGIEDEDGAGRTRAGVV